MIGYTFVMFSLFIMIEGTINWESQVGNFLLLLRKICSHHFTLMTDEGMIDAGMTDEGVTDEGMTDEGMTDEGMTDEGMADGGMTDGGMTDEG